MLKPELIVIDNFLPEDFLKEINNDKSFWEEGYSWWGGWWQSDARNNRHKLIEYIYKEHCPFPIEIEEGGIGHGDGFEHWIGIRDETNKVKTVMFEEWSLAPHIDKDEDYWEKHPQGKKRGDHPDSIRTPMLGTVFYTESPKEGGYLKIWDTESGEINFNKPYELIKPKRNRLVIFDAGKLHGVLKVIEGQRKAIAINIWKTKPTTEMTEDI